MSELFNRLICEWFHGGGSVTRDSNGRINWQCHRCGRWSAPVSHKEEAVMIDRDLANYRWKMKSDWQKDKASRCTCRGADEWCGCQNENPADYLASVKGDLPPKVMVWRSQPMAHIVTWATTRYPVEAVAYVPEATLSAAMELPEVRALVEAVTRQVENIDDWLATSIPAGPIESKSIYDQLRAALAAAKEVMK